MLGSTTVRRELAVAAVTAAAIGLLWLGGWLPALERVVWDRMLRLQPAPRTPSPVAAVVIDDASVAAIGPLPWPRARLAELVRRAREAGAAAVALDLLLVEPKEGDASLAAALDDGPAVLAAAIAPDGGWLLPRPELGGAGWAAHAYAEIAPDGVVRSVSATKQADGLALPALSVAAARLVDPSIAVAPGALLRPGFRLAPTDVPRLAAADLLDGSGDLTILAGRAVFLGVTAAGAGDRFVVPTGGAAPAAGVLVHAAVAASVLTGGLLRATGPGAAVALALAVALAAGRWRTGRGQPRLAEPLALVVAVGLLAVVALLVGGVLLPVASPVTAVLLAVGLREGLEARAVHRETGRLLAELAPQAGGGPRSVPRSAVDRLAALRALEREIEQRRHDMHRLVSHELKTPLASISGFASMLDRYELSPEELVRVAARIRGESRRLEELVAAFLDLERLGGGQWDDERRPLDLGAVVRERLEVLTAAAGGRGQRLVGELAEGVQVVGAVPLLERVVDNLVGNALKYSADGAEVRVRVSTAGDSARLEVTDDGPGIPPDALPRVFERFYRVPGVEGAGSGLGLALAREIVNWHGGCIQVESELGRGTTFTVELPLEREAITR